MSQNGTGSPLDGCLITETQNEAVSPPEIAASTASDPIQTRQSEPVAAESAVATMDSISEIDNDLNGRSMVTPSKKIVRTCLGRLSLVFEPNSTHFAKDIDAAAEVYANFLAGYSDHQIVSAFVDCGKTLRHFPYPADIIDSISESSKFKGCI